MLRLVADAGGEPRRLALPHGSEHSFGRDAACDVALDHESVSRRHAAVSFDGARWLVRDLGSRHGTFVNDRRVAEGEAIEIRDGDSLVVGPWRWRAEVGDARRDERIEFRRERRSAAETFATRPTIFLRLRSNDAAARELSWQEFFDRYAPVVRGYARHAGRHGAELEDAVQEVMLGFFQVSPKFQYDPARGRFRGYLKRCTLNALRRRARGAGAPSLSIDDLDPAEDAATEAPWEAAWAEQALERALREVAGRVDARTFEAFDLYARRGVPAETVAERLGIGVNSVHQAKTRVTKLVREAVDAIRAEEG